MKKLFIILLFIPLAFACSSEDSSLTQGNNSNRKKLSTLSQVTPCTNCEGSNGAYTYANNKLTYIDIDGFVTDEDGSFTHQWEDFMAFEYSPNSVTINYGGDKTILNIDTDGKVFDNDFVFNNGYLQEIEGDKYNWSSGNLISFQEYNDNGDLYSNSLIEYSDFDDLSGYLGLTIALNGGIYYADERLAEKYNVTLSEFMYNLVMCFKNQYDYIGMLSPREEKLAENLRKEKNKNSKLTAEIENADFRVKMEMDRAAKAINANDEFAYQLKEQKAVNADQLEELKRTNEIIYKLQEKNNKLKRSSVDTQLKNIAVVALGLFAGFSLKS